jgi:hypothetical protein
VLYFSWARLRGIDRIKKTRIKVILIVFMATDFWPFGYLKVTRKTWHIGHINP